MTSEDVPLVVLDRDGVVIVECAGWISDPRQIQFEVNAVAGMQRMSGAGVSTAIATNQSGIGRGEVDATAVADVNAALTQRLHDAGIDLVNVYTCPHIDADHCACRKPKPGLIERAIREGGARPAHTWFVGDMARDLQAGRAAGANVALVRTGKGRATEATLGDDTPVFADLLEFAEWLAEWQAP